MYMFVVYLHCLIYTAVFQISFVIMYSKFVLIFFSNIQLVIFVAGKRTPRTRKYTTREAAGTKTNMRPFYGLVGYT